MARQQYQEYWDDIEHAFVQREAKLNKPGGIDTRVHPDAARKMKLLQAQLAQVEEEMAAAQRAKDAVLRAKEAERGIEGLAERAQAGREGEARERDRAGVRLDRVRGEGKRPDFVRPHQEPRAVNRVLRGGPSIREQQERWGVSPIMGGGQTIALERAKLGRAQAEEGLARAVGERARYFKDDADMQEAVRLYKERR